MVRADDAPDYKAMYDAQKKVTDDLVKRVAALEAGTGNVAVAKSDIPQKSLDFLGQTEISGFAEASYLYNVNRGGGLSTPVVGRTFDTHPNQFVFDDFKLALEKPLNVNPTNWAVGYRADLIFGEDAAIIHSSPNLGAGSFNLGNDGDLEQAFIDVNVPIGNGLKVIFGKTVTLMGVEVIEQVSNPNFSEGNQFLYVENFTQTGVQLMYQWNDKIDTEFVVFNGWDQLPDNNNGLSYMGRIGYAMDSNTTFAVLGYGGPEQTGATANWRDGVELVATRKITDKFSADFQADYGTEENVTLGADTFGNPDWFALGGWLIYDFTDKIELAFRQDFLRDKDGTRTQFAGLPVGTTPEIYSSTLTLNLKPVDNFQFRPELRWDHADKPGTYNGERDQFTLGAGVAYLF
ncbi:MAG: outer membrane beta-barrel protein [Verrucomicrobiia bacterium]|jgi:hypothetical protein